MKPANMFSYRLKGQRIRLIRQQFYPESEDKKTGIIYISTQSLPDTRLK